MSLLSNLLPLSNVELDFVADDKRRALERAAQLFEDALALAGLDRLTTFFAIPHPFVKVGGILPATQVLAILGGLRQQISLQIGRF